MKTALIWDFFKPFIVIFAVSCFAMIIAYRGFFGGHDAFIHGLWTKNFAAILHNGYLRPRFANELNMGFGSLVFFFYPPLSLYFDSIFSFLGHDADFYYVPIKASAHLAIFSSGVACYYWLKNKTTPTSALLCALIYMTLPIHLLLDFYVTAVISQLWCYAWFPLIMLGSEKIVEDKKSGFFILSFSGALLILTNIPLTIIFPPFAFLYGLMQAKKMRHYVVLAAAWLMGIALSAFYTLPMMLYKNLVNIDLHWNGPRGLRFNEFFLDQKVFSNDPAEIHRFITLQCFLLTMIFAALAISKMKKSKNKIFFIVTCTICAFMCFSISKPVWELLPLLQKAQFPRRLLVIPTVIIPLAACGLEKKRLMMITICNLIILFMVYSTTPTDKSTLDPDMYAAKQDIFAHNMEFFPNYFPSKEVIPYFYDQYPFSKELTGHPKVIASAQTKINKWQSGDIELNISGKMGDAIIIRQFWFPGWRAWLDGQKIAVLREEKLKILKIILPRDVKNGVLIIKFEKMPGEIYGLWISLTSLLFWLGLFVIKRRRTHDAV